MRERREKRKRKEEGIKPPTLKNHLRVFVKSLIENPAFSWQTKKNRLN
jgi:DNA gyrase/topoisomerase IV subunit B